ncbi:DUF1054 family protein [Lactococcus nasutitermitis]|uniref:DUF1054 family protein n=1 Tax=Lactococcus nasutitermitis TaxID=1652957 RepID=A0ABV9JDG0_9LACT|nr:DUF1054 family protein [Lactococcus nasutitermitis]
MFDKKSFEIFDIEGLEPRMIAIRSEIQPIFQEIGEKFLTELSKIFPSENFYLHIAQHRRRTAYAPDSTWCAISTQKRGYKMEACFTLGIWKNHVFLYLSIIDQPKRQQNYAEILSENLTDLSKKFVLSKDHTKPDFTDLTELSKNIQRLKTVKKSEFQIGKVWTAEQFNRRQDEKILSEMLETIQQLSPIYDKLMKEE